jgi:hypothetical protein
MSKRSTDMREQHVQLLKGISIWLDQQPDTNELEKAVFNEIVQRVKERSKAGAIMRVRLKNIGNPKIVPNVRNPPRFVEPWTEAEMDRLRKLKREGLTNKQIGEHLGRTESGVGEKSRRLGLISYRITEGPDPNAPPPTRRESVLAVVRRINERKRLEAARRDVL